MTVGNIQINNDRKLCYDCGRNINQASNVITCHSCAINFHQRCSKTSTSIFRNNSHCLKCIKSRDIIRYNSYFDSLKHSLQDCDKPYLQNQIPRNSIEALSLLNAILEDCTNKSIDQFKCLEKSFPKDRESLNPILCQFLNIDGKLKNFDTLVTMLKSISHEFSIIALAETNIDPEVKEPYLIPNYASVYQRKKAGKTKGSGSGIYIHKSLNYQIMEELSTCCDDIESLFIEIKRPSESKPTIIGAIYRPPSGTGNPDNFHEKLSELLSSLRPSDDIILMGDFNLNLFSRNCHTNTFEESMFCNGFTPEISTATHKKPDYHFICIDNIFVNNSERVVYSCILESHISHHRSLILKYSLKHSLCSTNASRKEKAKVCYDYKPQNFDKLNEN